jgi:hypothetical protein
LAVAVESAALTVAGGSLVVGELMFAAVASVTIAAATIAAALAFAVVTFAFVAEVAVGVRRDSSEELYGCTLEGTTYRDSALILSIGEELYEVTDILDGRRDF